MPDVATLQNRLSEAESALHKLMTGKMLVEIHHGPGEVMKFSAANIGALRAYIADLKGELAAAGVLACGGRTRARRVAF